MSPSLGSRIRGNDDVVEWLLEKLSALPLWALYSTMTVMSALENVFPPLPSDGVIAIGSFLAARGKGTAIAAFIATWVGNVAGAMVMYAVGRKFGAEWLEKWLHHGKDKEKHENRLETMYLKYGLAALAVSRLLPGVRALVPPFAGAIRLPILKVFLVIALPSGLWYGVVTFVAFEMGSNLDLALDSIKSTQKWTTIGAAVLVVIIGVVWYLRRKKKAE